MATIYKTGEIIGAVDKDEGAEVDVALEKDE